MRTMIAEFLLWVGRTAIRAGERQARKATVYPGRLGRFYVHQDAVYMVTARGPRGGLTGHGLSYLMYGLQEYDKWRKIQVSKSGDALAKELIELEKLSIQQREDLMKDTAKAYRREDGVPLANEVERDVCRECNERPAVDIDLPQTGGICSHLCMECFDAPVADEVEP